MKPSVHSTPFGTLPDGREARLFTLTNRHGLIAKITNYGTIITELHVPDRAGRLADVVLGFDNLAQYLKGHPHFGCTTGRVANRIAQGVFTLDGKTYKLDVNRPPNHLHGGRKGFDKVLWQARPMKGAAVRLDYTSPDGEEGYPGELRVTVIMTLTDANELILDYTATTTKPTPVNLTNHSYFNLAGRGDIKRHRLMIAADFYTPTDAALIPTGEICSVKDTPLDFTRLTTIGARFDRLGNQPPGYDHNFVLRGDPEGFQHGEVCRGTPAKPAFCARLVEPRSGRVMEIFTTEPGVQLYTANWLDGSLVGKGGIRYERHAGVCLETQHFPNSINIPHFPSTVLRPGQVYRQTTSHRFSTL